MAIYNTYFSVLGLQDSLGVLPNLGVLPGLGRLDDLGEYAFSPASLFLNGEQGVWYDPSDLTPEKVSWRRNLLTYSQDFENAAWTKSNASILSNLLLYSQDLDNAYWTKESGAITANSSTAPDGTTTADLFVPNTTAIDTHRITRVATTVGPDTFSFYAKASGYSWVKARFSGGWVNFNVSNGTVGFSSGVNSPTITSVGSGWYRCSFVFSTLSTNTFYLSVDTADTNSVNTNNYAGDGTSGILFWGVQQVPGSTAQTYTRSLATAAPIQFADPLGGTLADKLVENTATSTHRILTASTITVSSGATVTNSVFVKAAERTWAVLSDGGSSGVSTIYFNLANGTFGTVGVGVTQYSATNLGSGWYRIQYTCVLAGAVSQPFIGVASADNTNNYTGDGVSGIYVYGAQVEQASTASAYQRITDFSSDFLAAFPTHALYQDSIGTTPVSALGQSVGLVIDKRLGGLTALGSTITSTGYTSTGSVSDNGNGTYTIQPSSSMRFNFPLASLENGATYLVTIPSVLTSGTGSSVSTDFVDGTSATIPNGGWSGTFTYISSRATYDATFRFVDITTGGTVAAIVGAPVLNKVPGNHAIQATSAARPTLQARSNLLTYTEQFDNGAWNKTQASITANVTVSPDSTTTADKVVENTATASHAVFQQATTIASTVYTYSVYVKAAERTFAQVRYENGGSTQFWAANINLTTGAFTTASFGSPTSTAVAVTDAGNGWWRVAISVASNNTTFSCIVFPQDSLGNNSYTGNGTSGIFVWGAQLELGSTATTYQRVVTATDYADVGLPRNLTFDGIDDSLATAGNVDFATWTVGTRRNLLTVPTMFDDAAWLKADVSVTANNVAAPDGTQTGDTVTEAATTAIHRIHQAYTSVASQVLTASVYAKPNGSRRLYINTVAIAGAGALFDLTGAGTVVATSGAAGNLAARIAAVGNGWYRCEVTGTGTGTANNVFFQINRSTSTTAADDSYLGDGTSGLQLWGAQLEVGSTATAFQDVGTDKVTAFAGLFKQTDAAQGLVYELSVDTAANNGSFLLWAPAPAATPNYYVRVRGTGTSNAVTPSNYLAPITNVVTTQASIADDFVGVRVNAASAVTSPTDLGTGNFGSYQFYVGRRASASMPFNGRLFQLVIRGAATDSVTVGNAERWVGQLTGVAL